MIVGVIGSGSIGPDLAYGFMSALTRVPGSRVYLMDISREALDAGMARVRGYLSKGLARGKVHPAAAKAVEDGLRATERLTDLADCHYVLEAATENLDVKRKILADLEQVVEEDCLIGFATSGIPRKRIAATARHPQRCFVNHPFFPAWRSLPVEVVLSPDATLSARMSETLKRLGKVPVVTADVPCFAADDIFCNYCAEAARIVAAGVATPEQVDRIVNEAIGGGGPFNVMDLTRGNLLNVHCLELMRDAPTGGKWFEPPPIFKEQANRPWLDRQQPRDSAYSPELGQQVLDRILAVLLGRTCFVVERGICEPTDLDWLTRVALGFKQGLLDLAQELGPDRVQEICTGYAKANPGYHLSENIAGKRLPAFRRHVKVEREEDLAVVTIYRPEVRNALNEQTLSELAEVFRELEEDRAVQGVILTSFDGSLAGADILELAVLKTPAEAAEKCRRGQAVLARIASSRKPVVAAVNGPVLGGGAELCMACHARVVGPELMWGQPEVNLGIIPGYGGTQRLPRLIGFERAAELLRTGRPAGARDACAWGWAAGEPSPDPTAEAKLLIRRKIAGETQLTAVKSDPLPIPEEFPTVDLGHHSLAIDAILVDVLREGLPLPLSEGLDVEAEGFARCHVTVDYDIGMKNFIQNGPRVPAAFLHE